MRNRMVIGKMINADTEKWGMGVRGNLAWLESWKTPKKEVFGN